MAINIPIISEFDGRGVQRAIKQFQQLETTGEKAQFAIKKAALPAAAALTGLAVALNSATKAAIEDQKEQAALALTLQNVTGAGRKQTAQIEKQITAMSRASGIADSDYRKSLEALVRGTKDVDRAMRDMNLVMDISTALQMDSATVADALAKAYQGNFKALRSLSPEMATMIKEGASLNEIMDVLGGTFGGAVAQNAETAAGKMAILKNSLDEAKESIGAALLPVLEKLLPYLQSMADWAGENTTTILVLITAVGGFSAALLVANATLKVYQATNALVAAANYALGNSFGFATTKIGPKGFTAGLGVAILTLTAFNDLAKDEDAFDALKLSFREAGQAAAATGVFVANQLFNIVAAVNNSVVKMVNIAIAGLNKISPFRDISPLPEAAMNPISQPSFFYDPPIPARGNLQQIEASQLRAVTSALPTTPSGGVTPPTTTGSNGAGAAQPRISAEMLRIANMETVNATLSALNPGAQFGIQERMANVTVNVTGGLATSAEIGESVVNALRAYSRSAGPLQLQVA